MRLDASAKLALRLATAGSFVGSFVAGLAPVAAQDAGVLYRETFDVPPSISNGKAIAAEQGWLGFRNGGSFNNPCADAEPGETCLQAFGPGCSAATPVNSDPVPGFTKKAMPSGHPR